MKPKKHRASAKPKRPSQLERDLRASIAIAKLQRRVSNLETAVLELQRESPGDSVRHPAPGAAHNRNQSLHDEAQELSKYYADRRGKTEPTEPHLCQSHAYPRS